MFYRYCSRRSTDVRLESVIRILRVLSTVCKRIYGLAFVYRRPCYHFPRRPLTFFLPGRSADAERGIKIGNPRKSDRLATRYAVHVVIPLPQCLPFFCSLFLLLNGECYSLFEKIDTEDECNLFFKFLLQVILKYTLHIIYIHLLYIYIFIRKFYII